MLEKELIIHNKLGLHARASTKLVKHASHYLSEITITVNDKTVAAKSIMGVMLLAASKGTKIVVKVSGSDEIEAMADIENLINNKFEEEE